MQSENINKSSHVTDKYPSEICNKIHAVDGYVYLDYKKKQSNKKHENRAGISTHSSNLSCIFSHPRKKDFGNDFLNPPC
jgi:hypothetical protein